MKISRKIKSLNLNFCSKYEERLTGASIPFTRPAAVTSSERAAQRNNYDTIKCSKLFIGLTSKLNTSRFIDSKIYLNSRSNVGIYFNVILTPYIWRFPFI